MPICLCPGSALGKAKKDTGDPVRSFVPLRANLHAYSRWSFWFSLPPWLPNPEATLMGSFTRRYLGLLRETRRWPGVRESIRSSVVEYRTAAYECHRRVKKKEKARC
jgi:hypothetical protein